MSKPIGQSQSVGLLVASLLLVVMPGATSSFLLLVAMQGATSSVLAPKVQEHPHGERDHREARIDAFPWLGVGTEDRHQVSKDLPRFVSAKDHLWRPSLLETKKLLVTKGIATRGSWPYY